MEGLASVEGQLTTVPISQDTVRGISVHKTLKLVQRRVWSGGH